MSARQKKPATTMRQAIGNLLDRFDRWLTEPQDNANNGGVIYIPPQVHMGLFIPSVVIPRPREEPAPLRLEFEKSHAVLKGPASALETAQGFDNLVGHTLKHFPSEPVPRDLRLDLLDKALGVQAKGVFSQVTAFADKGARMKELRYVHEYTDPATQEVRQQDIATVPLGRIPTV